MFRKIAHTLLALFLLVATTGISLSMHYCGGKLVDTSINKEAKACCDGTGGCCENRSFSFEVKDDYVVPVELEITNTVAPDILFPVLYVFNFRLISEVKQSFITFTDSSPPPAMQTRLSLLQTFLS
jgi:hypothetical protein